MLSTDNNLPGKISVIINCYIIFIYVVGSLAWVIIMKQKIDFQNYNPLNQFMHIFIASVTALVARLLEIWPLQSL